MKFRLANLSYEDIFFPKNFTEGLDEQSKATSLAIMSSLSARNLTLLGKIAILKSLVVSQIVYLLSSLPSPPGSVIKEQPSP